MSLSMGAMHKLKSAKTTKEVGSGLPFIYAAWTQSALDADPRF